MRKLRNERGVNAKEKEREQRAGAGAQKRGLWSHRNQRGHQASALDQ